jgi:hypothetical protein
LANEQPDLIGGRHEEAGGVAIRLQYQSDTKACWCLPLRRQAVDTEDGLQLAVELEMIMSNSQLQLSLKRDILFGVNKAMGSSFTKMAS